MKYFSIEELTRSATAQAHGIDNTPTPGIRANLDALVRNVLDPLREAWGAPITVTSGYRSPQLNKAVGGATGSQHMLGEAADISVGSKADNRRLFDLVQKLELPFDQLIDEKGFQWIHISYGSRRRRQVLHLK